MRRCGSDRLLRELLPEEEEVAGLLALMLLVDARRAARVDARGGLVRLAEQDGDCGTGRGSKKARVYCVGACDGITPGPYQLQAAINAVHSDARKAEETDWRQILVIYDQLMAMTPSPVVALNRAVVVAEVDGAEKALVLVEELRMERYHLWQAVRADLLSRLGRIEEARRAFTDAIGLCENEKEREFLEKRKGAVGRRG